MFQSDSGDIFHGGAARSTVQRVTLTDRVAADRTGMSESEWQTRIAVAACHRLQSHYRLTDLTNGFIAGRIPDEPDFCVVTRYGHFADEVNASNLVRMSIDHCDDVLLGVDVVPAAVPLFQSLFRARPEVNAIVHAHTKATETLSSLGCEVLPMSHPGLMLHDRTGYVDYAYDHDPAFCDTMVRAFDGNVCLLMRNHGMIALGRSPAEAFYNTFTFDQACLIQLEAYQSGREIRLPADVDTITASYAADAAAGVDWDGSREWAGWIRLLDRTDPSYRD